MKNGYENFNGFKRVVLKVGSNTVLDENNKFNYVLVENWAKAISDFRDNENSEFVIVSSGAVGLGERELGFKSESLSEKQLCASVGQPKLISGYIEVFSDYGINIGQGLLGYDYFEDIRRKRNLKRTFNEAFNRGVIKIINENDFINIEELCFGDNDKLSAMVANKVSADLLVLMSNIDGLYSNYNLEEVVTYVSKLDEVRQYVLKKKSLDGTGGMDSKFRAAEIFNGITMIVNGQKTGNLEKVLCGEEIGTLFDLK